MNARILALFVFLFLGVVMFSTSDVFSGGIPEKNSGSYLGPFMMLLAFMGLPILLYFVWNSMIQRQRHYFDRGIVPPNLKYTNYNILEVYVRLAARFIQIDREMGKEKIAYVRHFFARKGFQEISDIGLMLSEIRKPIKVESATNWLKIHFKSAGERNRIIDFLFGLIALDGVIDGRELRLLKEISEGLGVDSTVFDQLYHKHRPKRKSSKKEQQTAAPFIKSNRDHYQEVLGISTNVTFREIKKNYRSLVKKYHPDRYANASSTEQKRMNDKFLEIQEAFEYFEKIKKR